MDQAYALAIKASDLWIGAVDTFLCDLDKSGQPTNQQSTALRQIKNDLTTAKGLGLGKISVQDEAQFRDALTSPPAANEEVPSSIATVWILQALIWNQLSEFIAPPCEEQPVHNQLSDECRSASDLLRDRVCLLYTSPSPRDRG